MAIEKNCQKVNGGERNEHVCNPSCHILRYIRVFMYIFLVSCHICLFVSVFFFFFYHLFSLLPSWWINVFIFVANDALNRFSLSSISNVLYSLYPAGSKSGDTVDHARPLSVPLRWYKMENTPVDVKLTFTDEWWLTMNDDFGWRYRIKLLKDRPTESVNTLKDFYSNII